MKWIPISEFKSVPRWEGDTSIVFEVGTQLLHKDGTIILLGDFVTESDYFGAYISGGCDSCMRDWRKVIDEYTHYRILDLPTDLPY